MENVEREDQPEPLDVRIGPVTKGEDTAMRADDELRTRRAIPITHPPVLYVENDDNDVVLMRYAWKKVGVLNPLQVATDGDAALRYLSGAGPYANRVAHPMPSLVLTNLELPRVSGIDVLKWIRAEPAIHTLPVVVLSSWVQAVDVHTAYEARVNGYLEKPPTFDGWRKLVASVNDFWLTRAETPPECGLFSNPATESLEPNRMWT